MSLYKIFVLLRTIEGGRDLSVVFKVWELPLHGGLAFIFRRRQAGRDLRPVGGKLPFLCSPLRGLLMLHGIRKLKVLLFYCDHLVFTTKVGV